jgi:hypothetical protein
LGLDSYPSLLWFFRPLRTGEHDLLELELLYLVHCLFFSVVFFWNIIVDYENFGLDSYPFLLWCLPNTSDYGTCMIFSWNWNSSSSSISLVSWGMSVDGDRREPDLLLDLEL